MFKFVFKLRILEFGFLRKEVFLESFLVFNLIKMCFFIEVVFLINFKLIDDVDADLVQEFRDKCKYIREVKLCSFRIEYVVIGNSGEIIIVERFFIKMESFLLSLENTFGKVINKLYVQVVVIFNVVDFYCV